MSIEEALEPWLSKPTWFSSHPSDQKLFSLAMRQLKQLQVTPSVEELENVIIKRVERLPAMLGTPNDIPETARQLAIKIRAKL
ncbi:hypothetical protein C5B78_21865 [Aeromonas salmonicida]|uniref:hypothetical protein n=1 Tax=Aeromonas salmonicida TaxID=645 RepID=UPI000F780EB6|nr:hypothetical protein [Aeromonas salmonicida]RSM22002.1 hypothetical protein C5B78_21865 [Aeromonas salmonicida]